MRRIALPAAVLVVATACGGSGAPSVSEARIGAPTGPNAALYLTLSGNGIADRLIGASTRSAEEVVVHETVLNYDGTVGMRQVVGLPVPASGEVVLEPGAAHLMLVGVDRLGEGEVVEIVLTFEEAGEVPISATVVAADEVVTHHGG